MDFIRRTGSSNVGRPRNSILITLFGSALATLLCLSLAGPVSADDDDDDGGEAVARQVVVKFTPGAKVAAFNDKYNTRTVQRLPGGGRIYLLKTRKGVDPARLAARMRNDSRVVYAEPNFEAGSPEGSARFRGHPSGDGKPVFFTDRAQYQEQYATEAGSLNLDEAHGISRGAGTTVAVIDTGVQSDHQELAGKTTAGYDFVDADRTPDDLGDGRDNDFDGERDEMVGHGTHVAGIIALAAPEARIMPIRALDTEGRGNTFGIAKAIRYATRNGADVVSLSLGTSRETELLGDLLGDDDDDDGSAGNTVFVAAAGNDGDAIRQFPAAEEGVVSVTSVDGAKQRSFFSNYGGWVTVAAPGTDINGPFAQDRYATWSGTSMATPFVAAQAALIKSARPTADAACVRGFVEQTRDPLTEPGLGGYADFVGSLDLASDPATPCRPASDD